MVQKYVKAIAAFVVTLLVLFGGEEVTDGINVETVEALIGAILVAAGVAASPRNSG